MNLQKILVTGGAGFPGQIHGDASKPDGQPKRYPAVKKAENEFGFRAKTTCRECLMKPIQWYNKTADSGKL